MKIVSKKWGIVVDVPTLRWWSLKDRHVASRLSESLDDYFDEVYPQLRRALRDSFIYEGYPTSPLDVLLEVEED